MSEGRIDNLNEWRGISLIVKELAVGTPQTPVESKELQRNVLFAGFGGIFFREAGRRIL